MNVKELNGVFLTAIQHYAAVHGAQKTAAVFGTDAKVVAQIQRVDERRIREFVNKVEIPLFRLGNESFAFWSDLATPDDTPVDWANIAWMRSLLTMGSPAPLEGKR